MSGTRVGGISRTRSTSLKEKFTWQRSKRNTQSLKYRPSQDEGKSKLASSSPNLLTISGVGNKYNFVTDGTVKVHKLVDTSLPEKFFHSARSLSKWESHHVFIRGDKIVSETPTGVFSNPLPYSSITQVVAIDLAKEHAKCVKIFTKTFSILFQAPSAHQRDKWLYSLHWMMNVYKYKLILYNEVKPESILCDLKVLVALTLDCPLYIDDTHRVLLDLVSCLLTQKSESINNMSHEALITALAPIVEKNQPSFEICDFFTKHCHQRPRSHVVIDIFTPIVQRILKHNADFGKSTWLRTFVVEYIQALNSQNNGIEAVRAFIQSTHGPISQCPHTRILNNLIAVCLSAIYQCFSTEKITDKKCSALKSKRSKQTSIIFDKNRLIMESDQLNNRNCRGDAKNMKNCIQENMNKQHQLKEVNDNAKPLNTDKQNWDRGDPNLKNTYSNNGKKLPSISEDATVFTGLTDEQMQIVALFVEVLNEISKIQDWCPGLASLLQPLPFPDEAMTNLPFTRLMYPVIERFAEDERESVVKCLLYSREDKDGWMQVYSPGGQACEDDGKLFSKMIESFLKPGMHTGKLKKFMTMLTKSHLQVVIMLALRENPVMVKVLRDMLQMGILQDEQAELQVISALVCTPTGKEAYNDLKALFSVLTKEGGPVAFTLAPNSTDHDLKTLFSTGSWGSLLKLDLSFTNVTSASVDVITRLPSLQHLNLWATNFDDSGLRTLCDYLDLHSLNLCETRVTSEGIKCLEGMPNLEYLNLNSTELSTVAFLELKEKLPRLRSYDVTYTDVFNEV